MRKATTNSAKKTKGRTEVMTSRIVVPGGAAPLATKSKSPKGGVARLISMTSKVSTRNQTTLYPICSITGI